jgi:3-hydroxyisobutyrate dehydrogenase-like beta-hydroxyacid dehydrogenase
MNKRMTRIAIIGFGEVGGIFAADLAEAGAAITAFDTAGAARARAERAGVAASDAVTAVRSANIVFVCVTAGSVLAAMRSLIGGLGHAPLVVDVNSVSPATKQCAADIVEAAGGRYVEAAVMASVPPKRLRTPMLLGGPHAADFMRDIAPFGLDLTNFDGRIGPASSVKMCRSIMVKGIEALTTECMLAARHYGVESDVLQSLGDTLPHPDWPGLARYVISRALIHGKRRAEEMREVARTVEDAGLEPLLSRAIAERQDWAWRRGAAMERPHDLSDLGNLLDAFTGVAAEKDAGRRQRQAFGPAVD